MTNLHFAKLFHNFIKIINSRPLQSHCSLECSHDFFLSFLHDVQLLHCLACWGQRTALEDLAFWVHWETEEQLYFDSLTLEGCQ